MDTKPIASVSKRQCLLLFSITSKHMQNLMKSRKAKANQPTVAELLCVYKLEVEQHRRHDMIQYVPSSFKA